MCLGWVAFPLVNNSFWATNNPSPTDVDGPLALISSILLRIVPRMFETSSNPSNNVASVANSTKES